MNKIALIVSSGLTLIIIGVLVFVATKNRSSDQATQEIQTHEQMSDTSTNKNSNMLDLPRYKEYSSSVLADTGDKRRVLFFFANWCPTCRPADANFQQNVDQIPKDVELIRVNYNDSDTDAEEKELADKYQITYQHTFVQIDTDGNPITRWNGGQIAELLNNIK